MIAFAVTSIFEVTEITKIKFGFRTITANSIIPINLKLGTDSSLGSGQMPIDYGVTILKFGVNIGTITPKTITVILV